MEDEHMKEYSKDIQITGDSSRQFIFTFEQQKIVCEHFGKDIRNMKDYEIDELLNKLIDDLVVIG